MESIITIFQHPIINNQIFGNGIFNFQITQSMAGVVKSMDSAMKSMNLEKISRLNDKFESQFEDFDVQSSYMERTMSLTTTVSIPQSEVYTTIMQVANEAGLVNFISFFLD